MVVDLDDLSKWALVDGLYDFIAIGNVISNFILVKITTSAYNYS